MERAIITRTERRLYIGETAYTVQIGEVAISVVISDNGLCTTRALSRAKNVHHEIASRAVKNHRKALNPEG